MKLNNKKALVTGASKGVGREIAVMIAREGGEVGLVARSREGLSETVALIESFGGKALAFPADIQDEKSIQELAETVLSKWGAVDILINNAALWHKGDIPYFRVAFENMSFAQFDESLAVGLRAAMRLVQLFLPGMIAKKQGKILQISSTIDKKRRVAPYIIINAINAFNVSLAEELRKHQIQVNCIAPHFVRTEIVEKFFPDHIEEALDPKEIAKTAIFLVSSESDHITGQIIEICKKEGK